jgi:ATP-dependent RNA helicase SUPV3L1/SUV3
VRFTPEVGGSALADRALRQAAVRAVGPEVARRLGRMAAAADADFSLTPEGDVLWEAALTARILPGDPFAPRARLLGDLGPAPARDRAQRRIEAWLASETGRTLRDLRRLRHAIETGGLKGLPRGIAFRLIEAGGVIPRSAVADDLKALSQVERRTLKAFAIRIGAHSVWLPGVLKPKARALALVFADVADPGDGLLLLSDPPPSDRQLAAQGRRRVDRWSVPVEALERLADLSREGPSAQLPQPALQELGWTAQQASAIQSALRTPRTRPSRRPNAVATGKDSPFAALAALTQTSSAPAPARRKRRPRRKGATG